MPYARWKITIKTRTRRKHTKDLKRDAVALITDRVTRPVGLYGARVLEITRDDAGCRSLRRTLRAFSWMWMSKAT